ncbi:carboxylesterase/lipase family protein [Saccharopolyspora rhizosphaerae]|uniref:Carboxylic ester hydrolase n=1 Tax=Saccharopolyspora rhizosphaerae TaxID=2492662 RepID=A0A3R8Q816_9PSEU|nr:carboxylesterase family protein [Saccharopolyspora rhizosphaerae]RRO18983.1 carboxylesterase/lipase family protein [Saccharopolyspora rhizosphaerae]
MDEEQQPPLSSFRWLYGGVDLVVRTEHGAVRGTTDGDVMVFKGIPYAAPLDGARRFQAPIAPPRWDGLRDATQYSAPVPQAPIPPLPAVWRPGDATDCLTVNVWTPDRGGHLPVMVWLHGGAFLGGTGGTDGFNGATLAREGVVVVTVNYRVGYEGFGWVDDAPANRGILDQLAALRWVRDNIISFGGNPDNVTIFGESAGGVSVATLVAGSGRRGLFRRAIAQSPAAMYVDEDEARKLGELITGPLGVPATASALAELPVEDLHAAQGRAMAEISANRAAWTNNLPYNVVLDGEVLSELPWVALRGGVANGIDVIAGFNRDEATGFTVDLPAEARDLEGLVRDLNLPGSTAAEYRSAYPGVADTDLYTVLLSDQLFRMPAVWMVEAAAAAGGRAHLYEFTWETPQRDGVLGATHGLDVPFTFGQHDDPLAVEMLGAAPEGFDELSRAIRQAWTSFAATGDPGWPAYHLPERPTRVLGNPVALACDPIRGSRQVWAPRFPELG